MNYGNISKKLASVHGFKRPWTEEEFAEASGEKATPKRMLKLEERREALDVQMTKRWKLEE